MEKAEEFTETYLSDQILCAGCVPESHGSITGMFRAIAGRLG
jgi:hypothetical protein